MRILEVSQRYFPELGGTETHMHEISRRLARRPDMNITVFATDRSGTLPESERGEGFDIVRRRAWPRTRDYYFSPGLFKVIRDGDWDLVHFQGVHTFVPIVGMLAARSARVPFVLTFHTGGHSSAKRSSIRGLQWRVLSPLLRSAEALIAVSRFERKLFEQATGIDPQKFSVIRNGGALPPAEEGASPVPGRVISSGRLERYKGHQKLIEALPAMRAVRPESHVVILGSGPFEAELWAVADRLGVRDGVSIRHILPQERSTMTRELTSAQALAALSDYEAHPVGVMEALTLGIPVVGFDVAGIADLIEDGTVTGVPASAGPEVVAAALLAAMDQPRESRHVDLPTWEQSASAIGEIYTAIGHNRASRAVGSPAVVHITTTLTTGGAERQVQFLAQSQPDARVLCLYRSGPIGDALTASGTPVEVLGMAGWRKGLAHLRLARWLRRVHPDIVHAHMLSAQLWGVPAARLARVPVVISTEHSIMENTIEDRPKTPSLRRLYLLLERLGDQVIAVSDTTARRLIEWGVPAERISVVANGIDVSGLAFSGADRERVRAELDVRGRRLVVGVGRLVAAKRFDVAIEALAPLLAEGRTMLVLAGEGAERARLLALAEDLGVDSAVMLVGARSEIAPLLSAADVLVSPSHDETFGMAVVEALINGLHVVYNECPALDELPLPRARQLTALRGTSEERSELRAAVDAVLVSERPEPHTRDTPAVLTERYGLSRLHSQVAAVYERAARKGRKSARR